MKKCLVIIYSGSQVMRSFRKGLTLKMGSRMSWQKVLGSFLPSALVADLLNLPLDGSKYLQKGRWELKLN